jgi:hypothetical protein
MTVLGGEPPIDWDVLAPRIQHPTREFIVEALHWIGPLSAPDLKGVLDDPESHISYIAYHLTALVGEGILANVGTRPVGASPETLYFFPVP